MIQLVNKNNLDIFGIFMYNSMQVLTKEQVSSLEKGANILLSLMQLNIGGAETHVVELAKELKRKGFNVIVTSNGGVYVKELEEYGIKHYSVPLQNKNPFNMAKSKRLLKKIIRDEKIDIVHSHARIPSFILRI